jgi:alkylhydroperoxidase family enzyme
MVQVAPLSMGSSEKRQLPFRNAQYSSPTAIGTTRGLNLQKCDVEVFVLGWARSERLLGTSPTSYGTEFLAAIHRHCRYSNVTNATGRCLNGEGKLPEDTMTNTTRIPQAELRGLYGFIVKRMSSKLFGEVPEPVGVAWNNRKALNLSFSIGRKMQKFDQCDENLKTFAHMAAAALIGCSFCLDFGYFQAHNEGLDVTKAREVPRWRESDVFTSLERDVMEYAEAMTLTPPTVTDELSGRLLTALGPSALVELTTVIGLSNFMARGNTAFGVTSQEFSSACGLAPLAVASEI